MGLFVKMIISVFFKFISLVKHFFNFRKNNKVNLSNIYLFSNYSIKGTFNLIQSLAIIEKTAISIEGKSNQVIFNKCNVYKTHVTIKGNNNKIELEEGVKLNHAVINIRGTNCVLKIGANSTFGGVRIVNVGANNNIQIGSDCLFSDFIEVWASDTHSIFNASGDFINPELPVIIGDDVWVGSHVKILKGVTVGNGSIIGMNTVVTKDTCPYTLNVGNPMRTIKQDVKWTLKYKNEKY